MATLIVVNDPSSWPFHTPGVQIVSARDYLIDPRFFDLVRTKVFNLSRSYAYQSLGYYVSLLAAARGHRCLPSVRTIQDLKSASVVRMISGELEDLIQRSLRHLTSCEFDLSIYFGRNLAKRYDRLAARIFNIYPAPLLRASFRRRTKWAVHKLSIISGSAVPDSHRPFVAKVASEYFSTGRSPVRRRPAVQYDLAILQNPREPEPPSNERALGKFIRCARQMGIRAALIGKENYGQLAAYDALFIRETTRVNHHTYRFARRALEEGMVVIDDPDSILRCTNKVYLAELLAKRRVPTPRTIVVHRDNLERLSEDLGFPIVLKQPDSEASLGVVKVQSPEDLTETLRSFFHASELVLAQEFTPTSFDWRVGVLDGKPLYVCRYHMARNHWQIINWGRPCGGRYGKVDTLAVEDAPAPVVRTALRAAKLIGNGLYGVDIKEVHGRCLVVEVNDNPTIEAGWEDRVLGDGLYKGILQVFIDRIESRRRRESTR